MNKANLQKELKEKVKPGKPSDLKKEKQKSTQNPISPSPISITNLFIPVLSARLFGQVRSR